MAKFKLIIIVTISILAAIIIFQNRQSVETEILFIKITMPRFILLAITAITGFVVGVLFASKKKSKD